MGKGAALAVPAVVVQLAPAPASVPVDQRTGGMMGTKIRAKKSLAAATAAGGQAESGEAASRVLETLSLV